MLTQQPTKRTMLIVADDPYYRSELRTLLGRDYIVVGEASSQETAISLTAQLHPDLMLLDMELADGGDYITVLRQIKERRETVLIVADDPYYRSELRTLLGRDYIVVGEASSQETAISLTAQLHPDLMLLDMELGDGGDYITVLQQIQQRRETVKVVVLSAHQEVRQILLALKAGARGYVSKPQAGRQLEDALTTVLRNQVYLSLEAVTLFCQEILVRFTSTTQAETYSLSSKDIEVLQLLVKGLRYKQIAIKLHISYSTVKFYCERIRDKLQVENIKQAIAKAIKLGLIEP